MIEKIFLEFVLYFGLDGELNAMPGGNCAFYDCPTSRKHGISLFKIPSARTDESQETTDLKKNAGQAWLNLILRTRELTPELKKSIDRNNIHICERHFKPEYILTCELYSCILCV